MLDEIERKYTQSLISINSISKKLWFLYNNWKNNKLEYGCNAEKMLCFERKVLAYKYAEKVKIKFFKKMDKWGF